ncbi:uncharacterized protein LOC132273872 [Cornus florida]|uniref:uncharacterized protein LOC132273872 n=1 Tax=Cornus florida TaxID=4283 RepID=UPI0028A2B72F|nr:uncharacterized protein LOC132273872 [Cornus florida]
MVATYDLRARKFQDGLHLDIRPQISVLDLRTYGEVVQKNMLVEVEERDQHRIKDSYKQSREEASSVSVGGQWKKAKAGDSSCTQGQSQHARSAPIVPLQPQGSHSQTAKSSALTQGLQGACHYCKQPEHFKRECLRLQNRAQSGTGSQATLAQSANVQLGFRVPQAPQPVTSVGLLGQFLAVKGSGKSLRIATGRFLCWDFYSSSWGPVFLDCVCRGCAIKIAGRTLEFDFAIFYMTGFDVILGMDWLTFFRATIDYFLERVSVCTPTGDYFHFVGDRSDSHSMMIFSVGDWSCHRSYLASLLADEDSSSGYVYLAVVVEFLDVFPRELTELPFLKEVVFAIDVVSGTTPTSMALYRMAPIELHELKAQLDDLKAKGFIRPSASP